MEDSIFTKIINREYNSDILYEDDKCIVIFDIFPIREGHCLVIPKKQVDNFINLDMEDFNYIMKVSKTISKQLVEVLNVERVALLIAGYDIPHVHIHLIPSNTPLNIGNSNSAVDYKAFYEKRGAKIINDFKNIVIEE